LPREARDRNREPYTARKHMPDHPKPPPPDDAHGLFLRQMEREFTGWADPAARLRSALESDELELYCQPVLSLGVAGGYPMAEILVRLREEEEAMLPPGEFLPVFEHYGMMPQLDRWIVRHALAHLAAGDGIARFSINLSGQTLQDTTFPEFVVAQLRKARLPPGAVIFEIDETDMIERVRPATAFAEEIKRAGCGLLFDGFGRRSVSFTPLKALRFDYVKVDGVIVRNMLRSKAAASKMNAVARVGETIGVGVVAECVEDPETLAAAKAAGAHYAQGFGIARPRPIASIGRDIGLER
jgi:EAL domain-containing protein (putative c-di-GMP-specific phosphodiesterase class I)